MKLENSSIWLTAFIAATAIVFLSLFVYDYRTARYQLSQSGPAISPTITLTKPFQVSSNKPLEITWKIDAPTPRHIDQTTIYFDTQATPSALTTEDSPQAVGYSHSLTDYINGDFSAPDTFTARLTPPSIASKIYLRAYALIDGNHHWTDEYEINLNQ